MTDIIWISFDLLVNLFQSFLFFYFAFSILEYKKRIANRVVPFVCGTLILFLVVTAFNYITAFEGAAAFIYSVIVFVFLLLFTNASILKKVVISVIPTSAMAIVTTFSMNFTSLLFGQNIIDLMSISTVYRVFVVFLTNILLVIFLFILQRFFKRNDVSLTKTEWITISLVLAISIIVFLLLFLTTFSGVSEKGKVYIAFAVVLLIVIDLTVYVLLVQLSKKHQIEMEHNLLMQQYSFQAESAKEIKNQYEELQKVRHDFKNSLRVIQTLNKEHNEEKVDEYIQAYLDSQNRSVRVISTENEYVNAIVNSKLATANNYNIEVTVNVISDIKCSNNIDLCNIIGNMFDNAIDACKKCNNKKIYFEISKENNNTIIFMKNSIPSSILNINPQLETTKKEKNQHGYGTKIIRDLANKYHGFADFYEDNNSFCCNVVINL